jgi:hypothetical protein
VLKLVAIIRFVFGFTAACLVAGVVQVLFVTGVGDVPGSGRSDWLEARGLLMLLAATQTAVFSAPFAVLAAAVAAWLPSRSGLFFVGAALAIALAGFFAQYVGEPAVRTILNTYALSAYAASGVAAGLAYWLVAVPKSRPVKA